MFYSSHIVSPLRGGMPRESVIRCYKHNCALALARDQPRAFALNGCRALGCPGQKIIGSLGNHLCKWSSKRRTIYNKVYFYQTYEYISHISTSNFCLENKKVKKLYVCSFKRSWGSQFLNLRTNLYWPKL